jgi:hypothetical protein
MPSQQIISPEAAHSGPLPSSWPPGYDPRELNQWDQEAFERIISTELTEEQKARVVTPGLTFPGQKSLLAIHWHPEFIPSDLIAQRISACFRTARRSWSFPPSTTCLSRLGGLHWREVDCYAAGLIARCSCCCISIRTGWSGPPASRPCWSTRSNTGPGSFSNIWIRWLILFMTAVCRGPWPPPARTRSWCASPGSTAGKLKQLIEINQSIIDEETIKNKLLPDFFEELRAFYPERLINHAQSLLHAVKKIVKAQYNLTYFYRARNSSRKRGPWGAASSFRTRAVLADPAGRL